MASSTVHGTLIKYEKTGTETNQITIYPKTTGSDVSITANPNASSATTLQALVTALGSFAFKSSLTNQGTGIFSNGVVTTDLTVTAEGKIADARALKTLNDKITSNANNITKLNSKTIDITLSSGSWTGGSAPYSYVISNSNITTDNICDLIFNPNSQQLVNTLTDAEISGYLQENGKITIYSWGTKPSIDIPITLIVRGGI